MSVASIGYCRGGGEFWGTLTLGKNITQKHTLHTYMSPIPRITPPDREELTDWGGAAAQGGNTAGETGRHTKVSFVAQGEEDGVVEPRHHRGHRRGIEPAKMRRWRPFCQQALALK